MAFYHGELFSFGAAHVAAFWGLLLASLALFANTASIRIGALASGAADQRFDRPFERLKRLFIYAFLQKRMVRDLYAGVFHLMIFWGFVVLLLRSVSLILQGVIRGFDPSAFLGPFSGPYILAKDIFEVLVILGVLLACSRRLFARPARLDNSADAWMTLGMIFLLMLTDLTADGALIALSKPAWTGWAPASNLVAMAIGSAGSACLTDLFKVSWWVHMITLLGFLNFLPYSKHFHVLTALFNVYFADFEGNPPMRQCDLEAEHFGINKIQDLTWKQMLDLYTCTECGRCKEACPTALTGKPLKPKEYGNDLRDYLYATPQAQLASAVGPPEERPLIGGAVDTETIWACTTCGYCEHSCPLLIKFTDKLTGMRRFLTLEESDFPEEAQAAFKGMERQGNPWNLPRADRMKWAEGLDVPTIAMKPEAEYLFWVGCAGAYEERGKRVSRALVSLMKAAGISFAVLGEEESCTGDAARRLGNEYLFQTLAESNIETLNGYKVKKIVTNCPHCLQTLGKEYTEFGGRYEVLHGTQLVAQLLKEGRLKLVKEISTPLTYHDPCYLARYGGEVSAPRAVLSAIPGAKVVEMPRSKKETLCCGAGGGRMWLDEKLGTRINHERFKEVSGTGCSSVAVACPFCNVMLNNAAAETGNERFETIDIIEMAAKAL